MTTPSLGCYVSQFISNFTCQTYSWQHFFIKNPMVPCPVIYQCKGHWGKVRTEHRQTSLLTPEWWAITEERQTPWSQWSCYQAMVESISQSVPIVTRLLLPFIKMHCTVPKTAWKLAEEQSHQLISSSVLPYSKELISKGENNWLFWYYIIPLYFCQVSDFTTHCHAVTLWKNLLLTYKTRQAHNFARSVIHILCFIAIEIFRLIDNYIYETCCASNEHS